MGSPLKIVFIKIELSSFKHCQRDFIIMSFAIESRIKYFNFDLERYQ